MKTLKIFSTLALVTNLILVLSGICIATYYVDNLTIRGLFIFVLILSSIFVSNIRQQVLKIAKNYTY